MRQIPALALALALVAALAACDAAEVYLEPAPQTPYLLFRIAPDDTVAAGDTVTLTAVTIDTLDTRFRYCWTPGTRGRYEHFVPEYVPGERYCPGRTVRWVAPYNETATPGILVSYGLSVEADNGVTEDADGRQRFPKTGFLRLYVVAERPPAGT